MLKNYNFKFEYRTLLENVLEEFYIPALSTAKIYKRAVGFFSTTILSQISIGLCSLAKNGGTVQLLISPKLTIEDYEAIKSGYSARDIVVNKLNNEIIDPTVNSDIDRFSLLAYLIASKVMEIKVAIIKDKPNSSMFHEKAGIIYDEIGDYIAFSGSPNDSYTAFNENYETIDVFSSWKENEYVRCVTKDDAFDRLWNNEEKGVITIDFPSIIREKILKYIPSSPEEVLSLDEKWLAKKNRLSVKNKSEPQVYAVNPYDYQNEAVENWEKCNFQGVFDMATGTGKTITAGVGIVKLFSIKKRLIVIISCPYVHLVDQWEEEMKLFNITSVKSYSEIKDSRKTLTRTIKQFVTGIINFACIITTNATYMTDFFQSSISPVLAESLIICDEAHNFGSDKLSNFLLDSIPYRLALSATLERHRDGLGTMKLMSYFKTICYTYSLEKAIANHKLTPYYYFPIEVTLDDAEYQNYCDLSEQISKSYVKDKNIETNDSLKRLLIKRARLIAGTKSKIEALINLISEYKNECNMLVYCGAVRYGDFEYDEAFVEKRQIEVVVKKLHELGMRVAKFTSDENNEERANLKKSFLEQEIQALVAIKCLDEGVNIPAISRAFILASSTNPKEYIQRRGRVLRLAKGKMYAYIYDFIVLPKSVDEVIKQKNVVTKIDSSLVKKELQRVLEFSELSSNPSLSFDFIRKIYDAFNLDKINIEGEEYYE